MNIQEIFGLYALYYEVNHKTQCKWQRIGSQCEPRLLLTYHSYYMYTTCKKYKLNTMKNKMNQKIKLISDQNVA